MQFLQIVQNGHIAEICERSRHCEESAFCLSKFWKQDGAQLKIQAPIKIFTISAFDMKSLNTLLKIITP